ncbi:MAG: class I SAM-dependent methyltransferase [Actinomycetota bacterium]|nr:methyltransferase domain-containing protein [Actinomycetota bacterium]
MSENLKDLELRYGDRAAEYKRWWTPALVSFARPLLERIPVEPGARAIDLGGGVGAFGSLLRRRGAEVIDVDASIGMLRRAPKTHGRVGADVTRTPLGDRCADIVVSTFVLQHISKPRRLLDEAARVARRGGTVATATWGADRAGDPAQIVASMLKRAHVPEDPLKAVPTYHALVDTPAKMTRLARAAGLDVIEAGVAQGAHAFTPETFIGFVGGMGVIRRRLMRLPDRKRAAVLRAIERELRKLPPDRLVYRPDVVYLVARRPKR